MEHPIFKRKIYDERYRYYETFKSILHVEQSTRADFVRWFDHSPVIM